MSGRSRAMTKQGTGTIPTQADPSTPSKSPMPREASPSPADGKQTANVAQPARARKKRFSHPNGGKLTWQIAYFFPPQGSWTAREFLELDDILPDRPRLELANGRLEVL